MTEYSREVRDIGARPAQMGNLNKDSTHPNPWYPPTEFERMRGIAYPYRIYHHPMNTIGPLPTLKNFLEEDPLLDKIRWAGFTGLKVGTLVALNDIINVNAIDAPKARFARACFIVPPYMAMGVSFVCAREVLSNMSKQKDAAWIYPMAMIAPATIHGVVKNSFIAGVRATFALGTLAYLYKWNIENGNLLDQWWSSLNSERFRSYEKSGLGKYQDYNHETGMHRQLHVTHDGWKGWPFRSEKSNNFATPSDEPDWKKHVSPEEAKRGPPANV